MDSNDFGGDISGQSNSACPTQMVHLNKILDGFSKKAQLGSTKPNDLDSSNQLQKLDSNKLIQRFLDYVIHWNTRARTSLIGQCILNWVLTRWSPTKLLKLPNIDRVVESLLPYTSKILLYCLCFVCIN